MAQTGVRCGDRSEGSPLPPILTNLHPDDEIEEQSVKIGYRKKIEMFDLIDDAALARNNAYIASAEPKNDVYDQNPTKSTTDF